MNERLRGDDIRTDGPGALGLAGFLDDRGGGFVTGRFDAENAHG
jgi:hypothetical protein